MTSHHTNGLIAFGIFALIFLFGSATGAMPASLCQQPAYDHKGQQIYLPCAGSTDFWPPGTVVTGPTAFALNAANKNIVTLYPDGRVVLGDGYTPEGAAKAFWEQVQKLAPTFCGPRQ